MEMTSQIVSINPATEEINATFEPTPARDVERALDCAAGAAQTWRALPLSERARSKSTRLNSSHDVISRMPSSA